MPIAALMPRLVFVRALRCGEVATIEQFLKQPQVLESATRAEYWLAAQSPDTIQRACVDHSRRCGLALQLARAMNGRDFGAHVLLSRSGVRNQSSSCSHAWFIACDGSLELSSFASREAAYETAAWLLASSLVESTPLTVQWLLSVLIYYGAQRGDAELLEMLFESAVFCEVCAEHERKTLLEHATSAWITACGSKSGRRRYARVDVARVLLSHGTSLECLQRAAIIESPSVDQFLVDNGVSVRGLDEAFGQSPTWLCLRCEYLQAMVDCGADPRIVHGPHSWHLIISSGTIQAVEMFLDNWCVDVDARQREGRTPLMCAVLSNHTWTMRRLLDMGADLAATDLNGHTALCIAVTHSSPAVVELLLALGADPNQTDVLKIARCRWRPDGPRVIDLLQQFGAQ